MSEKKGPEDGGAVSPPKQFVPLPPKVVPSVFNALSVQPGHVLWVEVPKGQAEGHEQAYARPWVVVSANRAHRTNLDLVIAVPLTSHVEHHSDFREARIRIPKEYIHSLDVRFKQEDCLALTEHVRSISLDRCPDRRKVGDVSPEAVSSIRAALRYLLGLGVGSKP